MQWATPVDLGRVDGRQIAHTERTLTLAGLADGSNTVPARSVLLSTRAPIGYVATNDEPMSFNQGCRGLVPTHKVVGAYLRYALLHMRPQLQAAGTGSTFMEISSQSLGSLKIPVVGEIAVQRDVVDFLDRETAKIDALITTQRTLVDSLLERRSAVIANGLETTPDGRRLKHLVKSMRQGWSPECEQEPADGITEWGVLKTGCMNGGVFRPQENKRLPEDVAPRLDTVVRQGEIVMSRASTRELVGSAALVDSDYPRLMLSDKTYALRVNPAEAEAEFVTLLLSTPRLRRLIQIGATGASHSMQNISREDILNLPVAVPSLSEQRDRLKELEIDLSRLRRAVAKAEELVEALRERRAALITAAVAGRIDVTTYGGAERSESVSP